MIEKDKIYEVTLPIDKYNLSNGMYFHCIGLCSDVKDGTKILKVIEKIVDWDTDGFTITHEDDYGVTLIGSRESHPEYFL